MGHWRLIRSASSDVAVMSSPQNLVVVVVRAHGETARVGEAKVDAEDKVPLTAPTDGGQRPVIVVPHRHVAVDQLRIVDDPAASVVLLEERGLLDEGIRRDEVGDLREPLLPHVRVVQRAPAVAAPALLGPLAWRARVLSLGEVEKEAILEVAGRADEDDGTPIVGNGGFQDAEDEFRQVDGVRRSLVDDHLGVLLAEQFLLFLLVAVDAE
jgi:hypothetical protein